MRKLAKIAAPALAAVAALGAIVPTAAQAYPGQYDRGYSNDDRGYDRHDDRRGDWGQINAYRGQIDNLQRMIQRRGERGLISRREAAGLNREVFQLRETLQRFARDGLSRYEAQSLQNRIAQVSDHMVRETRDGDYRRR